MDKLIEILNNIKPGIDLLGETDIIGKGLLDSLSIIQLTSEICDEYDIDIPVTEIIPENFNSIEAMMNMINRLSE